MPSTRTHISLSADTTNAPVTAGVRFPMASAASVNDDFYAKIEKAFCDLS